MFWLGFAVTLAGAFCLAVSQPKQSQVIIKRTLGRPWQLAARGVGSVLLAGAATAGAQQYGLGIGLATFLAWAFLGSWLIALYTTWKRGVAAPAKGRRR
ncbi:MAG: DUF3325 family protein [Pseudomonadota bacterium]